MEAVLFMIIAFLAASCVLLALIVGILVFYITNISMKSGKHESIEWRKRLERDRNRPLP